LDLAANLAAVTDRRYKAATKRTRIVAVFASDFKEKFSSFWVVEAGIPSRRIWGECRVVAKGWSRVLSLETCNNYDRKN
jgi:hypothetical protein